MLQAFKGALDLYDRVVIPCAGRFTIAEAAVDAGWRPEEIECSDISLFSSVLGYAAAQTDLNALPIEFHSEFADPSRARGKTAWRRAARAQALPDQGPQPL
jgi:hypothetical protein